MPRFGRNDALVKKYPWLGRWIEVGVPDDKIEVVEVDRTVFNRTIQRSHHVYPAYLVLFDTYGSRMAKVRGHRFFADSWNKTIAQAIDACGQQSEVAYMLFVDDSFYADKYFSFYYARNGKIARVLSDIRKTDSEKATAELDAVLKPAE